MMKRHIFFATAILLTPLLVWKAYLYSREERVLVSIGEYNIRVKDKNYRDKIEWIIYPQDDSERGLEVLKRAFTYARLLTKYGEKITERHLLDAEMQIDPALMGRPILKKIRDLFGADEDAYRKVFLLPLYAEKTLPLLHAGILENQKTATTNMAYEFLRRQPSNKVSLAVTLGREAPAFHKLFTIEKIRRGVWDFQEAPSPKKMLDEPNPFMGEIMLTGPDHFRLRDLIFRLYAEQFDYLPAGTIFSAPVPLEHSVAIARFVGTTKREEKSLFLMEAIFFPVEAIEFNEWFQREAGQLDRK